LNERSERRTTKLLGSLSSRKERGKAAKAEMTRACYSMHLQKKKAECPGGNLPFKRHDNGCTAMSVLLFSWLRYKASYNKLTAMRP
jgi:hypothetical protein